MMAPRSTLGMLALFSVAGALLPTLPTSQQPRMAVRPALHPRAHHALACAEREDGPASDFQVVLRDADSDRSIECEILETTEVSGRLYASMTPIDTPVAITSIGDGMMLELEDEELMQALLPTAQAVASEMGLTLLDTAVTLTVSGELSEIEKFDESTLGLDEVPEASLADMTDMTELEGVEEEDEDDDGAEVLLSFRHEKQTYYLVRLLEPIFVVGRQASLVNRTSVINTFTYPTPPEPTPEPDCAGYGLDVRAARRRGDDGSGARPRGHDGEECRPCPGVPADLSVHFAAGRGFGPISVSSTGRMSAPSMRV